MKKGSWIFCLFMCMLLLVSCEKNMTEPLREALRLQRARVHITVGDFSDSCTVSCTDGEYVLSDFSRSALHDLTVRIGDGKVYHTLADLSLSPVSEGVDGFLKLYRFLAFLQRQEYHSRDAEHAENICFSFSFEGEPATVTVTESGKLLALRCGLMSMEIQEGND